MAKIERDESYQRDYIPLPGGWEVQTKGRGSSFRICDTKTGERVNVPDDRVQQEVERMAREVFAARTEAQRELAAYKRAMREAWDDKCCTQEACVSVVCVSNFDELERCADAILAANAGGKPRE